MEPSVETVKFQVALDRIALEPGVSAQVHAVVRLEAVGAPTRVPMCVVCAVDTSGSMNGAPLRSVVESILALAERLEPYDRLGVVSFADQASLLVPVQPCTPEARATLRRRLRRLLASGNTNVEAGLRRAYDGLRRAAGLPANTRRSILLLSDGVPNKGLTSRTRLAALVRSMRPHVALSTLGFGAHHHEDLMLAMAEAGAGHYHFIPEPSICDVAFAQALGAQGDAVLDQVELRLIPAPGARVVGRVGGQGMELDDLGRAQLPLPDLIAGEALVVVARLEVAIATTGASMPVVTAELRGRRGGEEEVAWERRAATVGVEAGALGDVRSRAWAQVALARAEEARVEARALADADDFEHAASTLHAALDALRQAPDNVRGQHSADTLALLKEAIAQLEDEAATMESDPAPDAYRHFKRHSMAVDLSTGATVSERVGRAGMSRRLMASVSGGGCPTAFLVVQNSPQGPGARYALREDQILGRTSSADITLDDPQVSRRHARIVARAGAFLVVDLGSTNPTQLNGAPLRAAAPLSDGDTLTLGRTQLVYDEVTPS